MNREKVIIVGVASRRQSRAVTESHLDELARLVDTSGGDVVAQEVRERKSVDAATYIGSGAVEEIAAFAAEAGATLVVFDDDLSPGQAKNLEKSLPRVTDRSGIILEIFSRHARSREARTQVDLARCEYLLPRLAGRYAGLSRLGGGIGGRGAGEQQIELDRRRIRRRIAQLKRDLEKIESSRQVQKRGRRHLLQIAIAGYTNAGKTTLYNRLTGSSEIAADRLFATLDARVARAPGRDMLFVDTVGLIRKLPPGLVASFRSTLGEIRDADLVVHAIDASSEHREEEAAVASEIFAELGVEPDRILPVYTKTDLAPPPPRSLGVSAAAGDGIEALLAAIERRTEPDRGRIAVRIPYDHSREIARARANANVLDERDDGDALLLCLEGPARRLEGFARFQTTPAPARRKARAPKAV